MRHIGDTTTKRLTDAAKAAGMNNRQAAEALRVNPRTWRRWVNGERACPWATEQWFLALTGQHPRLRLVPRKRKLKQSTDDLGVSPSEQDGPPREETENG